MPSVIQVRLTREGKYKQGYATGSLIAWADSMVRLQAERTRCADAPAMPTKAPKAVKPVYSASKAHQRSYRPDLPLSGTAGSVTITAADRAYYAAHPITLTPSRHACRYMEQCETCGANRMSENAAAKARDMFGALNIHESEPSVSPSTGKEG